MKVMLSVEICRQPVEVSVVAPSAQVPEAVPGMVVGPVCKLEGRLGNPAVPVVAVKVPETPVPA